MSAEGLTGTVDARDVEHCYRVFLGREAESAAVVEERVGRRRDIVLAEFVASAEFRLHVFQRIVAGAPSAAPSHDRPAHPDAADWAGAFLGHDEDRDERLRRADTSFAVLAAIATAPVLLSTLEAQFGKDATAAFGTALQSQAIAASRRTAVRPMALTLRCGALLLGSLAHVELGLDGLPADSDIWDFGLADFARLSRLDGFAVAAAPRDGSDSVHPLPVPTTGGASQPLASRGRLAPRLMLADLWFASRHDLALRFEGDGTTATLDVYQCPRDGRLVKLAAAAPIGQPVAIVSAKLFNPFAPVLLVIRDAAGSIRLFDHIPFPSLARGGLHAAERAICGNGQDDLSDMALLSAELLDLLLRRREIADRTVASIDVDPAAVTGGEPIFDRDLLDYLADHLGVAVAAQAPGALADRLVRPAVTAREGTTLLLPADAIPTLSALIRPVPPYAVAQTVTGSYGIVARDRQDAVHSVWMPPLGAWLDELQWRTGRRAAPMMRIGGGGPAKLCLGWPLALSIREVPVPHGDRPPTKVSAEIDLPLLRIGGGVGGGDAVPRIDIVVLFEAAQVSSIALLESVARQQGLGEHGTVLICRAAGTGDPEIVGALDALFPRRGRIVEMRVGAGRLEQLITIRCELTQAFVLVLDAATLLTDRRTVATLAAMLSIDGVASAGCLIRSVEDGRRTAGHAGYALTHADLRTTPSLGFSPIGTDLFDAPVTLPVAANTMAAMLVDRALIDSLPPGGPDGGRPAEDDILLGLAALEGGGLNLCTSVVSAISTRPASHRQIGRTLPYRLDTGMIDRLVNATAVIQKIR